MRRSKINRGVKGKNGGKSSREGSNVKEEVMSRRGGEGERYNNVRCPDKPLSVLVPHPVAG